MSERDCEKCKHHTKKGCKSWDCNFERRMTREKAIKIMRKEIECLSHSNCRDCILEKVCDPNTNPSDDEYIEAFGMAINSLEIDERYELEYENAEEIHREKEQAYMQGYEDACKKYRQEPKTGHWTRQDNKKEPLYGWYLCSECNSLISDKTKFCGNCGAKMEGRQNGN